MIDHDNFIKMRRLMTKLKEEAPTRTIRDGDFLFTDGNGNWYKRDAITGVIIASTRNVTLVDAFERVLKESSDDG